MAFNLDDPPVSFVPIRGLIPPTRQDTNLVVARSEAVRQAVENARNEKGKKMYKADTSPSRKKSLPKSQAEAKLQNARDAMTKREQKGEKTTVQAGANKREAKVLPATQYANQLSPTQYEQREIEGRIINTNIPPSLYDARIQPDTVYFYEQQNPNGPPDLISIPGYSTRLLGKQPGKPVQPVKRPPQKAPKKEETTRVSFGTRGNRPTYQPGPGGRRGTTNRLQDNVYGKAAP